MANSEDLWVEACKNVAREVYRLQLAEYQRLRSDAANTKSLTTHRAEAVAFAEDELVRGWNRHITPFPPNKIQVIKQIREIYGCGLKEAKDLVDAVQETL